MQHIDEEKARGNELCKLLCNLGSLESHMAALRMKILEHNTRIDVVAEISAFKTNAIFTRMSEKLSGEFDISEVMGETITIVEDLHKVIKKVAGTTNSDLRKEVQSTLDAVSEAMLAPLVKATTKSWEDFLEVFHEADSTATDTLPDLAIPMTSASAEKLKLVVPGMKSCFASFTDSALCVGCTVATAAQDIQMLLKFAAATISMADVNNMLLGFLEDGALDPSTARLGLATDFIGMFWTRLKELDNEEFEACSGQEKVGQLVDRLKPLGSKYAEELVAPLDAAFKANIFSHKHLRDM